MHPVEHLIYFSGFLIYLIIIPSHPIFICYHLLHTAIGPSVGHIGYQKICIGDKHEYHLGTYFHQLHHKYCQCNYGHLSVPWDKLFGTFHDGNRIIPRLNSL